MDDPSSKYPTNIPETEPDPTESGGLEAWSVALIIAAAVLALILIVGYIELKARKKQKGYTSDDIDEVESPSAIKNDHQGSPTAVHVQGEDGPPKEPTVKPEPEATPSAAEEASPQSELDDSDPSETVGNGGTAMIDATEEPPPPADEEQVSMEAKKSDEDGGEENKGFENEEDEVTQF